MKEAAQGAIPELMAACDAAIASCAAEPGPLLTFSLAYLDGVMEGEPAEVRRHWARVRAAASGVMASEKPCGSVCRAGQQDGIGCAPDECDRANGTRPGPRICEFPVCAVHHICDRYCTRNAGVAVDRHQTFSQQTPTGESNPK